MDTWIFQDVVTIAVAVVVADISSGRNGGGNVTNSSNQSENKGHPRECTYNDFANYKPKPFNGTGSVITLMRWFEKIESVFEICVCPKERKVNFATCTLSDRSLSWCNGHINSLTLPVAKSMNGEDLKVMMLEEYGSRGEIQKLEQELWDLIINDSNIEAYTTRFNNLAILCHGIITSEGKKIKRFI